MKKYRVLIFSSVKVDNRKSPTTLPKFFYTERFVAGDGNIHSVIIGQSVFVSVRIINKLIVTHGIREFRKGNRSACTVGESPGKPPAPRNMVITHHVHTVRLIVRGWKGSIPVYLFLFI